MKITAVNFGRNISQIRTAERRANFFLTFSVCNGKSWFDKIIAPLNLPQKIIEFSKKVPSIEFAIGCNTSFLQKSFWEDEATTSSASLKGYSYRNNLRHRRSRRNTFGEPERQRISCGKRWRGWRTSSRSILMGRGFKKSSTKPIALCNQMKWEEDGVPNEL